LERLTGAGVAGRHHLPQQLGHGQVERPAELDQVESFTSPRYSIAWIVLPVQPEILQGILIHAAAFRSSRTAAGETLS